MLTTFGGERTARQSISIGPPRSRVPSAALTCQWLAARHQRSGDPSETGKSLHF
jgi:hypothetical protein